MLRWAGRADEKRHCCGTWCAPAGVGPAGCRPLLAGLNSSEFLPTIPPRRISLRCSLQWDEPMSGPQPEKGLAGEWDELFCG